MAANRSAGRAAEFVNVGRNVVAALKSGPVETGPTVPVATALYMLLSWMLGCKTQLHGSIPMLSGSSLNRVSALCGPGHGLVT